MKTPRPPQPDAALTRRDFLKGSATAALGAGILATAPASAEGQTARRNLVAEENAKPGARDWQLTRVRLDKSKDGFRAPDIEGYCSRQSVKAGESLDIFVSTKAANFTIEIFRTGYYGGCGARLITTLGPIAGKEQPDSGLVFKRDGLSWRLSGVELPPDTSS